MSVERLPITTAQLAGIISEGVLYGLYLVTCGFCAQTLLLTGSNEGVRWVRLCEIRWLLAAISMAFFIISSWDMAIGILHLVNAFIKAEDPTVEFNKAPDWINIARAMNQSLTVLLSDFVLIYRCWIIYEQRWKIIAPSLVLYLGAIAMTIKVIEIEVNPHAHKLVTMAICPWNTTMFGINAAQNILTTSILVWRIWCIEKMIDDNTNYPGGPKANPPRHMQKIMRVIAESGIIYTTAVVASFLASASGSNAVYIAADMSLQTAGIVFNVIIIRTTERNNQELCVGIACPGDGRITPMFQHTARDASVE